MKNLIQFTYSYLPDGARMWRKTTSGEEQKLHYEASFLIQNFRDALSAESKHIAFGYTFVNQLPITIYLFNREKIEGLDEETRVREPQSVHINAGEMIRTAEHVISYYKVTDHNLCATEFDFALADHPYPSIDEAEYRDAGKEERKHFTIQKNQTKQIAKLAEAFVRASKENKTIFLRASDDHDSGKRAEDIIVDWMGKFLTFLPAKIANEITFCSFCPDPKNSRSWFKMIGVIENESYDYDNLSSYGYVFDCTSNDLHSREQLESTSSLSAFFADGTDLADWKGFLSDLPMCESWEQFLFYLDVFCLEESAEDITMEELQFWFGRLSSPYNHEKMLENALLQALENRVPEELGSNSDFLFLAVQMFSKLLNVSGLDDENLNECAENLTNLLCGSDNPSISYAVLRRLIAQYGTLEEAFGENWPLVCEKLSESSDLKKGLGMEDGTSTWIQTSCKELDTDVLLAFFRIFAYKVWQSADRFGNQEEKEILNHCASLLIGSPHQRNLLWDVVFSVPQSLFLNAVYWLLTFRVHGMLILTSDMSTAQDSYATALLSRLSSLETFDEILEFCASRHDADRELCKKLLEYKWCKNSYSLKELYQIFLQRNTYRSIQEVFDEHYDTLWRRSLTSAFAQEKVFYQTASTKDLLDREGELQNIISKFNAASGKYRDYVEESGNGLETLLTVLGKNLEASRCEDDLRGNRVNFILKRIRNIPEARLKNVLTRHYVQVEQTDDGDFKDVAMRAVKEFLERDVTQDCKLEQRKIALCTDLEKESERVRCGEKNIRTITEFLKSLGLSLAVALANAGVSFLLAQLIQMWLPMITQKLNIFSFGLAPCVSFAVAIVLFFYNSNILFKRKKYVVTAVEAILVTLAFVFSYYGIMLLG